MDDYSRVERIIRFLDENRVAQPSLSELASEAGLSESHFHRLFRRWAGVTPKDFLQCLTVEHAKEKLRESASVLDTAIDVGLSGPGRLHDLFVTLEAVSPGEFKLGGSGIEILWGWAETPFGVGSLGWSDRGICHLAFHARKEDEMPAELQNSWREASFRRDDRQASEVASEIFTRSGSDPKSIRALVRGTPFQVKVWRALLQIPEGDIVSYRTLAGSMGTPKASRAVGTACGANSIGFLIPCHRVIRETGIVEGYRWGRERKKAILAWEALHSR